MKSTRLLLMTLALALLPKPALSSTLPTQITTTLTVEQVDVIERALDVCMTQAAQASKCPPCKPLPDVEPADTMPRWVHAAVGFAAGVATTIAIAAVTR